MILSRFARPDQRGVIEQALSGVYTRLSGRFEEALNLVSELFRKCSADRLGIAEIVREEAAQVDGFADANEEISHGQLSPNP